jgi:hypothetical protein
MHTADAPLDPIAAADIAAELGLPDLAGEPALHSARGAGPPRNRRRGSSTGSPRGPPSEQRAQTVGFALRITRPGMVDRRRADGAPRRPPRDRDPRHRPPSRPKRLNMQHEKLPDALASTPPGSSSCSRPSAPAATCRQIADYLGKAGTPAYHPVQAMAARGEVRASRLDPARGARRAQHVIQLRGAAQPLERSPTCSSPTATSRPGAPTGTGTARAGSPMVRRGGHELVVVPALESRRRARRVEGGARVLAYAREHNLDRGAVC